MKNYRLVCVLDKGLQCNEVYICMRLVIMQFYNSSSVMLKMKKNF